MHLVTVMALDRSRKAYVMADSLAQLISAAQTEFALDASETYTVSQEPSGIKIGSDNVLQLLANNAEKLQKTLEVSVCCSSTWKPAFTTDDALNTTRDANIPPSPPTSSTRLLSESNSIDRSPALPMRPIVDILNPVLEVLQNPQQISPKLFLRLKKTAIREVYTHIGKFMLRTVKDMTMPTARHYARTVLNYKDQKYGKIFEIKVGSNIVNNGLGTLALQIYNHLNYSKGDENKKKRRKRRRLQAVGDDVEEDVDGDLVQMDKSALDYGCQSYAPPLPEDETEELQRETRERLLLLDPNDEETKRLMKLTFASQRADLNRAVPLSTKLLPVLEQWPLLCHRDHLFAHADVLLGKQVLNNWLDNLGKRSRLFCDFMVAHWSNENSKKSSQLVRAMTDVLDLRSISLENIGQMANNICLFPLLVGYLKEQENQLFILMPKNSTDEEMLATAKRHTACPVLVVRGSTILEEEADFDVVLLGKRNIKAINFIEGILTVFVSYFIFGFQYPPKICRSLEFIQRFLLEINPERGTKREKPSRLVDGLDCKVKELSEKLAYHGSTWGL